ncbi:RNA-directed DNA polymerase, eukaryota, reverse transcriptase zinc-binding domain protein [Tanacetum coccineum]
MKNNEDAAGDLDNVESSSVIKERVDSSISQVEEISELVHEDLIDKDKQGHEEMNGADYMDGGINDRQQNDTMSKEGSVEKEFTKGTGEEVVLFDEVFVKEGSEKGIFQFVDTLLGCLLGKPVMMDQMTSDMCKGGTRRLGYARVLAGKLLCGKKNFMLNRNNVTQSKYVVKPKVPNPTEVSTSKINNSDPKSNGSKNPRKSWKISKENVEELKRSANKFSVLTEEDRHDEEVDIIIDKRLIVDEFIKKKLQPSVNETKDWDYDMINYFKYSWEAMEKNENELSDDEDVNDSMNQAVNHIIADEVLGNVEGEFHKIVVGWDPSLMNVMVTHSCKQTMLCLIESVDRKVKFYCSFVYASNSGIERRELWSTLLQHKAIVDSHSWTLMGDFNVILKPEEQSNGPSGLRSDISESRDAVNSLEIDDLGPLRKLSWKDGNIFEKVQEIKKTLEDVQCKLDADPFNKDYVQARLSDAEASAMITMVIDDEIKEAIFDIDSTTAASPDGYSSCFFKKAWKCIGKDVCEAIRDFFTNGKLLGEINTTLIALVPKMDTPNKVSDFRPIACCNVLYKCISKILTNRIKDGLSKVISLNQSAFIPGRHIQDNILIAQELLKGYNRKNGAKRCAMKIDIQKAYDTVNWEFLRSSLTLVGFHETMINWIMNIAADPSFKYHHGCKELKLTHMCFADDLMILCNGDSNSLKVIQKSLDEFSNASGLFPNLGKSTIFFGSINEDRKRELLEVLPFKFGKLPMKYLQVPLIAKKLSLSDCKSLIESVEKRVNCWRNKLLSYAGRIQLIASVLSSMQQYRASVYIIPISAVKELDKMFKRFLWNSGNSAQGKARGVWSSIWNIEGNQSDSWGWGQLMMVRDLIMPFVKYKIGNGKSVSMWFDNWSGKGPLEDIIPRRSRNEARMKDSDCVADLIHNGDWIWPNDWLVKYPILNQIHVPNISHQDDYVVWIDESSKETKYTVKKAWESLREKRPHVNWYHVTMKWNKDKNLKCPLCKSCPDSHDHLFFGCDFSKKVWEGMKKKGMFRYGYNGLKDTVVKLAARKFKSNIWQINNKIILSATVYNIWVERNKRIFTNEARSVEVLIKDLQREITIILMSLSLKESGGAVMVAKIWGLTLEKGKLVPII